MSNAPTNSWDDVWADYDAHNGAPTVSSATSWYMDPNYLYGLAPPARPRGLARRAVATVVVLLLALLLDFRYEARPPAD